MRIFFALDVISPWKELEPPGRYIDKHLRHITLLFIGEVKEEDTSKLVSSMILPNIYVGPCGIFDKVVALPFNHPNVVSYRAHLLDRLKDLQKYKTDLVSYVESNGILLKEGLKKFLPHVSLCRRPFSISDWKKKFSKLPFYISTLHLYESIGNSKYKSLWSYEFISPFIEVGHTGDIAFHIRGENFYQLFVNGFIALCFTSENLVNYFIENESIENIDDVIISLNKIITALDTDVGSPFKAVSFQSNVQHMDNYLEWEMIVDV